MSYRSIQKCVILIQKRSKCHIHIIPSVIFIVSKTLQIACRACSLSSVLYHGWEGKKGALNLEPRSVVRPPPQPVSLLW